MNRNKRITALAAQYVHEFKKLRGRTMYEVIDQHGERVARGIRSRYDKAHSAICKELLKPDSPRRPFAIMVPKEKAVLIARAGQVMPGVVNLVCYDAI